MIPLLVSNLSGGGAAVPVLRIIGTGLKSPQNVRDPISATKLYTQGRKRFFVGRKSGTLRFIWDHYTQNSGYSETAISAANTLQAVEVTLDGKSQVIVGTFGGATTRTFATKEGDVPQDDILPSAFGLTEFVVGDAGWIKFLHTIPTNAANSLPIGNHFNGGNAVSGGGSMPGEYCEHFDPANGSFTAGVNGPLTSVTGATPVSSGWGPSMLVGDVSSKTRVDSVLVIGDSISYGQGDSAASTAQSPSGQIAWPLRGAFDNAGANPIPVAVIGRPGDRGEAFGTSNYSALRRAKTKYADQVWWALGTNDADPPGSTTPSFSQYAGINAAHAAMLMTRTEFLGYVPDGKFGAIKLLTRTDSTDSWSTIAGQTVQFTTNPEWWTTPSTSNRDTYNALLDADLSAGTIQGIVSGTSVMEAGSGRKWATVEVGSSPRLSSVATGDGTHPSYGGTQPLGQEFRTKVFAMAGAVQPLSITGTPSNAAVGSSVAFTPTISGGTAPYTLSLLSGTLPPGRSIVGNAVTGTYTAAGTYNYTLRATDSAGTPLTADLAITGLTISTGLTTYLNETFTEASGAIDIAAHTSDNAKTWAYWTGNTGALTVRGADQTNPGLVQVTTAAPRAISNATNPGDFKVTLDFHRYGTLTGEQMMVFASLASIASTSSYNGYRLRYQQSGTAWDLVRQNGSTANSLGTFTLSPSLADHTLVWQKTGSQHVVTIDGTEVLNITTDAAPLTAGGSPGVGGNSVQTATTGVQISRLLVEG